MFLKMKKQKTKTEPGIPRNVIRAYGTPLPVGDGVDGIKLSTLNATKSKLTRVRRHIYRSSMRRPEGASTDPRVSCDIYEHQLL